MRHCSIMLTMDTYGHLIAGAEAAAVSANADMTAVPAIVAATGTDGTCIPFISRQDAKRCVPVAKPCDEAEVVSKSEKQTTQSKTPQNVGKFSSACNELREPANTRDGTRTEPGKMLGKRRGAGPNTHIPTHGRSQLRDMVGHVARIGCKPTTRVVGTCL
jgi:hypothetical protein